jgi:hypothetical protein
MLVFQQAFACVVMNRLAYISSINILTLCSFKSQPLAVGVTVAISNTGYFLVDNEFKRWKRNHM